jgi:hypothetical protein
MHSIELAWSSHALPHFWTPIYLLAKTNSDIELLKAQVSTLSQANADMINNLKISESVFKYCLTFIGFVIASLAAIFTFMYGKGLKEVRQEINSQVKVEVFRQIKTSVSGRISALEQIIDREDIIRQVSVEYLVPPDAKQSNETKLLKARGFDVKLLNVDPDEVLFNSEIFILDLFNSKYLKERQEELVRDIGKRISSQESKKPVFVIYINGNSEEAKKIPDDVYCLLTNSKATLVGAVVNAANTSYAIKDIK